MLLSPFDQRGLLALSRVPQNQIDTLPPAKRAEWDALIEAARDLEAIEAAHVEARKSLTATAAGLAAANAALLRVKPKRTFQDEWKAARGVRM